MSRPVEIKQTKSKRRRSAKPKKSTGTTKPLSDYLPSPSKNYLRDCEAGRLYARDVLLEVARHGDRALITATVFEMIDQRYHTGRRALSQDLWPRSQII